MLTIYNRLYPVTAVGEAIKLTPRKETSILDQYGDIAHILSLRMEGDKNAITLEPSVGASIIRTKSLRTDRQRSALQAITNLLLSHKNGGKVSGAQFASAWKAVDEHLYADNAATQSRLLLSPSLLNHLFKYRAFLIPYLAKVNGDNPTDEQPLKTPLFGVEQAEQAIAAIFDGPYHRNISSENLVALTLSAKNASKLGVKPRDSKRLEELVPGVNPSVSPFFSSEQDYIAFSNGSDQQHLAALILSSRRALTNQEAATSEDSETKAIEPTKSKQSKQKSSTSSATDAESKPKTDKTKKDETAKDKDNPESGSKPESSPKSTETKPGETKTNDSKSENSESKTKPAPVKPKKDAKAATDKKKDEEKKKKAKAVPKKKASCSQLASGSDLGSSSGIGGLLFGIMAVLWVTIRKRIDQNL